MGKLFFVSVGVVILGSFVVAACVGDSPTADPGAATQGAVDGPCFANGTCNAGLGCSVVMGTARCVTPGNTSPADASSGDDSSAAGDASPSDASTGPQICKFQTTTFPCGGQMPPTVCFGATQSCTLTGCGVGDLAWQCFSPRQCSAACCLTAANATVNAGANCAAGSLQVSGGATEGATCALATTCAAGDAQLCQANSDCPSAQKCSPVKIVGGGAAINGSVVAVCVP